MIGISHIPYCYGYLAAMVTKRYINNSFVLLGPYLSYWVHICLIGSIFDMEVP